MNDSTNQKCETQDKWEAIHDFMPPGPARLRVNGTLQMPTPGYKLSLHQANPQGINPQILLLQLDTEAPTDVVPQVITPTPVRYELETDFDYTHITILPAITTIEVQKVY